MDEPLSNLDAKLRLEMRAEIRRIHNLLGSTTIYVTHDQDEALSLADRIVVLRDGVVRQVGTPEELYAAPAPSPTSPSSWAFATSLPVTRDGRPATARHASTSAAQRCAARRVEPIATATAIDRHPARRSDRRGADGPIAATVETAEYRGRDFFGTAAHRRTAPSCSSAPSRRSRRARRSGSAPIRARVLVYRGGRA